MKKYYEAKVEAAALGKRQKMVDEAAAFINTLHEKRREKVDTDCAGGVYEDNGQTLLKILDESQSHYEIAHGTQHIAEYAAYRNNNLKSLDIPSSIKSIGARAFWGCKNLEKISCDGLEMQLTSIGPAAFMNCKKLERFSAEFLANVRFIGREAFSGMDSLKEIDMPQGLTEISEFCFGCDLSLISLKIPSTVTTIRDGAFFFCSGLTELTFPDSVEKFGNFVFSTCKNLKTVHLPKSLKEIPERTFSFCESLSELEIPSKVKAIQKLAFQGTASLKTIRFRGRVGRIDPEAFSESCCEVVEVPWYLKGYYKKLLPNLIIKARWI